MVRKLISFSFFVQVDMDAFLVFFVLMVITSQHYILTLEFVYKLVQDLSILHKICVSLLYPHVSVRATNNKKSDILSVCPKTIDVRYAWDTDMRIKRCVIAS